MHPKFPRTGYLKRLGRSCPKLVRVYSENIEHEEFPLPGDPIPPKRQSSAASASVDPTLKDIALHHLIRKASNEYSEKINFYDEYFAECPDDVSDKDVQSYKRLVTMAEVDEIKSAEILLCTCSVSSSPRMTFGSCVSQVSSACADFIRTYMGILEELVWFSNLYSPGPFILLFR